MGLYIYIYGAIFLFMYALNIVFKCFCHLCSTDYKAEKIWGKDNRFG